MGKSASHLKEAERIRERAEQEGRPLSASEIGEIEGCLDLARAEQDIERQMKALVGGSNGDAPPSVRMAGGGDPPGGQPGDVFVNSQQYKAIRDSGARPQVWSSGPIDVGPLMQRKGT